MALNEMISNMQQHANAAQNNFATAIADLDPNNPGDLVQLQFQAVTFSQSISGFTNVLSLVNKACEGALSQIGRS